MKKHSFFSVLTVITCLVSATLFFSSCEQEDINGASAPITTRSTPEVPEILEVGEGFEVSCHAYAEGVQVYIVTETAPGVYAWILKEPIATLYNDAAHNSVMGTHYVGPTWESNSGSTVVGTRLESVTVDPTAIAWLKLGAVSSHGPGVFNHTTHIQRINTVGGKAPATGANESTVGEEIEIPYTAEYYFYKAE